MQTLKFSKRINFEATDIKESVTIQIELVCTIDDKDEVYYELEYLVFVYFKFNTVPIPVTMYKGMQFDKIFSISINKDPFFRRVKKLVETWGNSKKHLPESVVNEIKELKQPIDKQHE